MYQNSFDNSDVLRICNSVSKYAEEQDYLGYEKHDALNSTVLSALSLNNPLLRLIIIQSVMRSPINLRGILRVKKKINAKGMGLWAIAYLNLFRYTKDEMYLHKSLSCLDWLLHNNQQANYSGYCWGYSYDWQDKGFFAKEGLPNCVVTAFVGEAFMYAYEVTKNARYLEVARSICNFFLSDLTRLHESEDKLCLSYVPLPMNWVVLDTSALSGALIANVYSYTREKTLLDYSKKLLNYVVSKQTDYGAWFYSDPPNNSHITHDNYHTGYILDSILKYSTFTEDESFTNAYMRGLLFYKEHLFTEEGAPKWMYNIQYPHDIHGSAQGIITFARASIKDPVWTNESFKILQWSLKNMINPTEQYFYYQKGRWITKKFTFMRWCNAWMARAMSEVLVTV